MDEKRFGDGLKGRGQKDEIKGLGEGELNFPQRLVLDWLLIKLIIQIKWNVGVLY